jgi:hypothetical protein
MLLSVDNARLFGLEIINMHDFTGLISRFVFNLGIVLVVVRFLYYAETRRKDYLFTYLMISIVVFLLCYLLESIKLELGFALGLFAIFGIIRYRTDTVPIKEMTYLFVVIGISVINALANKKISIAELLFTNLIILFVVYGYEKIWLLKHESAKIIVYDKIDLILPEKYNDLVEDVKQRTGIENITRIDIGRIDLIRDTCRLTIYYEQKGDHINLADQTGHINHDDNDIDD